MRSFKITWSKLYSICRKLLLPCIVVGLIVFFVNFFNRDFDGKFRVGGRLFEVRIPSDVIFSVDLKKDREGVLLLAWWPTLISVSGSDDLHGREERGETYLSMLLTPSTQTTSLQFQYDVVRRSIAPVAKAPSRFGLEHLVSATTAGHLFAKELFYSADPRLTAFILCDAPGSWPKPQCSDTCYIGPFLARIGYPATDLPQWKIIQDKVQGHIMSFVKVKDDIRDRS